MRRAIRRAVGVVLAGGWMALRPGGLADEAAVNGQQGHRGSLWRLATRLPRISIDLAGRCPDRTVSDERLAERVRSELAWAEERWSLPRIGVTVDAHVATVYGHVPTATDARVIEEAVAGIRGVTAVRDELEVG